MSRNQARDAHGRFANGFHRTVDELLRAGGHVHKRTIIDAPAPLRRLADGEPGAAGEKYRYLVAVRATIRWSAHERPERVVEAEYADPSRERLTVREVPGRVGCSDGRVQVRSMDFDRVPRWIAVEADAGDPLGECGIEASTRDAYGDALEAHEVVHAEQEGDGE